MVCLSKSAASFYNSWILILIGMTFMSACALQESQPDWKILELKNGEKVKVSQIPGYDTMRPSEYQFKATTVNRGLLRDGKYEISNSLSGDDFLAASLNGCKFFAVENGYFLPCEGETLLKDGRHMEFYLLDEYNSSGNRAYLVEAGTRSIASDGHYTLPNNQEFSLINGFIDGGLYFGFFEDGKIYYEDRD